MGEMHPPGLFPEASAPSRPKAPWVLAAVVCTALLALLGALLQIRRLSRERAEAVESLAQMRKRPPDLAPRPVEDPKPTPEPAPAPPAPAPSAPGDPTAVVGRVAPARLQDPQ